jgi:flagellar motor switch protein FliN
MRIDRIEFACHPESILMFGPWAVGGQRRSAVWPVAARPGPSRTDIAIMPAEANAILGLEVPLIVEIGSRDLAVKEVMNLAPGAILELPKLADDELEILVNNKPIGVGRAVKVGENFGVRLTYVGDLQQRIKALGIARAPDE